jgi:predicted P-loop ATPase
MDANRMNADYHPPGPDHSDGRAKKASNHNWRRSLIMKANGAPRALLANTITALRCAPEWAGVFAYNEFSLRVTVQRATPWCTTVGVNWSDYDDSRAAEWLQHNGILVGSKLASEAVRTVAMERAYHPVREYLRTLKWDGTPRLDTWLSIYLGAPDSVYLRAVGPRWLISGVARVERPGCQCDHTLLLIGSQGLRKSTALRILASDSWFTDHISDLRSKDARIELHGIWIMEFSELNRLSKAASAEVKNFLSARTDHFRPPYGRGPQDIPRMNIFAGTTNDDTPLTDETGNRRFWPVRCGDIDTTELARDRDQLWAEAYRRYKDGSSWWLESDELAFAAAIEQDDCYEAGVWDDTIIDWLSDPTPGIDNAGHRIQPFHSGADRVTVTDVLLHAIGKPLPQHTQADKNQVARCLKHLNWRPRRLGPRHARKHFYIRPTEEPS